MKDQNHNLRSQAVNRTFWFIGLGSLVWLLLRSGTKLRRLAYPCQRAALVSSLGFIGYLLSLLGAAHLYRRLKQGITPAGIILFVLALLVTSSLQSSDAILPASVLASLTLPAWTSPSAVSDVFVVPNVPVPQCSLNGGTLPSTPPCNDPSYALHDNGVDTLINLMESKGTRLHWTTALSDGLIAADDIVVIKINNQWIGDSGSSGYGRLSTSADVLKGLIWRILQHPDGFTGEIVIAENTQEVNPNWNITPANAQDQNQSYQDVVDTFQSLGYAVSLFTWDNLHSNLISGGSVNGSGYPIGEYANGNMNDAYILLEDPAATGTNELSYPKFKTANNNYISMRYGVWDNSSSSYDSDRLIFINLPVLKKHGMAGSTIAWKNLIGFVTIANEVSRYGSWDIMHDFYWGYMDGVNRNYGLVGRELALIRAPDLNLIDAIWVATDDNTSGNAVRQNVLLAGTDPFAVDWYASEYVLRPVVSWDAQDSSAARGGIFRSATRTNQNAAWSVWPGGSVNYPYIDLLDTYDGTTPTNDEKNQMNVYQPSTTPNLSLSSATNPHPVQATTGAITYTITLQNSGGITATGVAITSTIPNSTTHSSHSSGGSFDGANVVWTGLTVVGNSSTSVSFQVSVTPPITDGDKLVNDISASSAEGVTASISANSVTVGLRPVYLPIVLGNN